LKFARPLVDHYGRHPDYRVLTDTYRGHVITDERKSKALLRQADVIFCEWALGNLEWYSRNKHADQSLVVRLHLQELNVPFLDRVLWDAVDAVFLIAPETRNEFLQRFPQLADRTRLIYNLVDLAAFDLPKHDDARFTLGVVGVAPRRKRPDLAIEIVRQLREHDPRYTLRVKGRNPREYEWLWRRPEEREFYERLLEAIEPDVADGTVVLDPQGNDVGEWFRGIGHVLSTSDFEGSHQAVAEGMASGAVPAIRNWRGADMLYPERFVFETVGDAVARIRRSTDEESWDAESRACRRFARRHFDASAIAARYDRWLAEIHEKRELVA
jgi:glycosyltransferase involved in cell wall biosynthesis